MGFVQKQNVSLTFNGGLQSKIDSLQLQPNNMLQLENARFTKDGQISKRSGFGALSRNVIDGSTISQAIAINTFKGELLLFDGNYLYTYMDEPDLWVNRGTAISVVNSSKQIMRAITASQSNPDGVSLLGIDVYVWQDSRGGVRYSALDTSMGCFVVQDSLIFDPIQNENLTRPKCISDGTNINIFYSDGGGILFQNQINPERPAVITNTTRVITDGNAGSLIYDVAVQNAKIIYAYNAYDVVGFISPSEALYGNLVQVVFPNGTTQVLADGIANAIAVTVDSTGTVWVAWVLQPGAFDEGIPYTVWVAAFTSNGVQQLAPTQIGSNAQTIYTITCVEGQAAGSLMMAWETLATTDHFISTATVQLTGAYQTGPIQRGLGLASKAFKYNGNVFVNAASQSTFQSSYFTLCLTRSPIVVVGAINRDVGGGYRTNNMLAQCDPASDPTGGNGVDTGAFLCAFGKKGVFQTNNNTSFSLVGISSEIIDFAASNAFNGMTFNNNFLFVGACVQNYDGVSVTEQNFHLYPENIQATPSSGGGSLGSGLYQYQFTYEWTDNFGQTQFSAPSLASNVSTSSATSSVALTIPTLRVTAKQNTRTPVSIGVYRTQVNSPVFYKLTNINNDVTVDSVSYTDTASDISIAANAILYTASQVANTAPPACSLMSYYQDRLILGGLEDENLLWYSQPIFDLSNYSAIAPEFSDLFTIGVDSWKGGITALSWMDDKLLIFKANTIYILTGDGPNPNGTGNDFSPPQSTMSTVGCANQNSIAWTYNGVFFQNNKGIYLIDRGLNVTYKGAAVEAFNDLTITSAEVLDQTDEVVWTTAEGTILVYNYYFDRWSTWSNVNLAAVDSCMWRDNLTIVDANGQVLTQNDPTNFTDNGEYITLTVQTPWLAWGGMQGYQSVFRCFLLGNLKGPHLLTCDVNYDYNPAPDTSFVINSNLVSNVWGSLPVWGANGPWGLEYTPYQFQINFTKQKCQALQLTFSDSPTSSYTEGYTLNSLTFEVGILGDGVRMPLGNKVSGNTI